MQVGSYIYACNPLQYSCLGNPMHRGAWWAIVLKIAREVDLTLQLNKNGFMNEGISTWLAGWLARWRESYVYAQINGYLDGFMDVQMNG